MKKIRFTSLLLAILLLQIGSVYAKREDAPIENVTISKIDYPYSTGSILDTDAELTLDSRSTVSEIRWSKTAENMNMVTVIVRPDIYYYYDENTTATINGNPANSIIINEDKYLEVSYIFGTANTSTIPNSSNSLKHTITVLYMKNGTISPNPIRAPHNKNFTVQIIPDEGYEVEDVVVDGESVGAVTEYTFKKVKETHKIKAFFKPIEGYIPSEDEEVDVSSGDEELREEPEKEFLFTDVTESDWYYDSVKYVFDEEIFSGTSATEFSPKSNMTRGMLVKVLYNIEMKKENVSAEELKENVFDDVEEDAWYAEAVAWASVNNIVNGVGNNLFAPNKEVTREQVASILYRYEQYLGKEISDLSGYDMTNWVDASQISEYANDAVRWSTVNEIITGKTTNTIAPKATATRAEVAKMLTSFLTKDRNV